MSETTLQSRRPDQLLLDLVLALLTPMFLEVAGGNVILAHQAAVESLKAYRAETNSDLVAVAKIIAFGLATLAALSRALADDLSDSLFIRLHASANSADRAEHRNRRLLEAKRTSPRPAPAAKPPTTVMPTQDERHHKATRADSAAPAVAWNKVTLSALLNDIQAGPASWTDVLNAAAQDFGAARTVQQAEVSTTSG
jgi:hypothetical protein